MKTGELVVREGGVIMGVGKRVKSEHGTKKAAYAYLRSQGYTYKGNAWKKTTNG